MARDRRTNSPNTSNSSSSCRSKGTTMKKRISNLLTAAGVGGDGGNHPKSKSTTSKFRSKSVPMPMPMSMSMSMLTLPPLSSSQQPNQFRHKKMSATEGQDDEKRQRLRRQASQIPFHGRPPRFITVVNHNNDDDDNNCNNNNNNSNSNSNSNNNNHDQEVFVTNKNNIDLLATTISNDDDDDDGGDDDDDDDSVDSTEENDRWAAAFQEQQEEEHEHGQDRQPEHRRREVHDNDRSVQCSSGIAVAALAVVVDNDDDNANEEIEIEFCFDDGGNGDEEEEEENNDEDVTQSFFNAAAEDQSTANMPTSFRHCSSSPQKQLPLFVPSPSAVSDFDVFVNAATATAADGNVGNPAGVVGDHAATVVAASEEFMTSTTTVATKLDFDLYTDHDDDDDDDDDDIFGDLLSPTTTQLRNLQQPTLDLDELDDDDDDDYLDDDQDHQQLLQDLQQEAISSSDNDNEMQQQHMIDRTRVVVHTSQSSALSSYESLAEKAEREGTYMTTDPNNRSCDDETGMNLFQNDERVDTSKMSTPHSSSNNLVELAADAPTPLRGSQRKSRTSIVDELALGSVSSSLSTRSRDPSSINARSFFGLRLDGGDTGQDKSNKSWTLCIDQYGPATFDQLINDLKDNESITELYVFRSWSSSNGCKRSTNDIIQLFDAIRSIKHLKVLKLANFNASEFDNVVECTQWHHPNVTRLQLHICQGSISKQTLEQLVKMPAMEELVMEMDESFPFHFVLSSKSLKKLTILSNNFDLDNIHLISTVEMLRKNRVLRSLVIEPQMKLRAFKLLAYSLRSNTTLEEVKVSLKPSQLDNGNPSGRAFGNSGGRRGFLNDSLNLSISNGCTDEFDDDDETSAAVEVANMLRTNTTLKCLQNMNSSSIKLGQKGRSEIIDALLQNNVVVDFKLFDEEGCADFTKSKDSHLKRNQSVFAGLFGCSSIDLSEMVSRTSSATSSAASVYEDVAVESKAAFESVCRDYRDISNSLVTEGIKALSDVSSMVDTMYKQFNYS